MTRRMKPVAAIVATTITAAVAVAGCGGGSTGAKTAGTSTAKGGTINYLYDSVVASWDPQRAYIGVDLANAGRLFSRSLVQLPVTSDVKKAAVPVPDLATNTGTKSDGAKTWSFTLKSGVKWQDGKAVSCADAKYGLERNFDPNLSGGPTYAWSYLNVSHTADGLPKYQGPTDTKNQAEFDKAVVCSGNTITYHFAKPFPDFPLALAGLREFDPYRKDKDQGVKSNLSIFSDGPYMLQGTWQSGKGGTFVRNTNYDAKTDGVRKALPDKFVFQENTTPQAAAQRLIKDNTADQTSVEYMNIPPSNLSQLKSPNVKDRVANPQSPFVDYILPNFNKLKNPKVRQALSVSLDQAGYVQAYGGSTTASAARSLVSPAIVGYKAGFNDSGKADSTQAKSLLKAAGVQTPYPITFTYRSNAARDAGAAAIAATWNKSGFKVKLNPVKDKYYDTIRTPSDTSDVYWAGWGADWQAASTVLPPLFDSRVNLTKQSRTSDYGSYSSTAFNKLVDQAAQQTSVDAAAKIYNQADAQLEKDFAYFPLIVEKFVFLYGSKVTNYINNQATSAYPDLGSIGVKK